MTGPGQAQGAQAPGRKGSTGGCLLPRSLAALSSTGRASLPPALAGSGCTAQGEPCGTRPPQCRRAQLITQITELQLPGTSPKGKGRQGDRQRPLGVPQAPSPSGLRSLGGAWEQP